MSPRVALFLKQFISRQKIAKAEVVDLAEYNFPLFEERLKYLEKPQANLKKFAKKVKEADGIIIISPEYNGGYTAALKNAIDVLYDEWYRKPIALASVSSGPFAASQVNMQLCSILWKMKAQLVPATFQVPFVGKSYDEKGNPSDKETSEKLAGNFIGELLKTIG